MEMVIIPEADMSNTSSPDWKTQLNQHLVKLSGFDFAPELREHFRQECEASDSARFSVCG